MSCHTNQTNMSIYIPAYNNAQHFKEIKQHLFKIIIYTKAFLTECVPPCCELKQFHFFDIKNYFNNKLPKTKKKKISFELQQLEYITPAPLKTRRKTPELKAAVGERWQGLNYAMFTGTN